MDPTHGTRLLVVACLVVSAGCLGTLGAPGEAPRVSPGPSTDTPVQVTTPSGDWDPSDSLPLATFASGPAVCEPAPTTAPGFILEANGSVDVVTMTVSGSLPTDDAARRVPPGTLVEDAPGEYTLWVATRADPDRTPSVCDGHVPYEAVFDLPHGHDDSFVVRVLHDGELAGVWEQVGA